MSRIEEIKDKISSIVEKELAKGIDFDEENPSVPLVHATYGVDEISEALESMLSTYLTVGGKVEKFESEWARYVGSKKGLMFNSGSSANLAALKALSQDFDEDPEVIVPAIGWSTTVFPIFDASAKPVFVDVDPDQIMMDPDSVEEAVNNNTEAIMVVHLLGNPAPMDEITQIAEENDLKIIEDCAEAHGAEFKGDKVGSIGAIGTFSFSFSHHVTTAGEGGIAVTNSEDYRNRMKILRSWGKAPQKKRSEFEVNDIDLTFVSHGYNLRPTEIQASFGIHQTGKMEEIVRKRRENAFRMNQRLSDLDQIKILEEREEVRCSYLHYPIVIEPENEYSGKELREFLEENGIETRPMISGNLAEHPAFKEVADRVDDLSGAELLHTKGLYLSCHSYLTDKHIDHMVETLRDFFG